MSLRLVLIDDHQLFRDGLRSLLETQHDFEVVGEASDARTAYEVIGTAQPDVVLMDVSMPNVNGMAATRELKRRHPEVRILLLSMHETEDIVVEGLQAGALGYALKQQGAPQIFDAV